MSSSRSRKDPPDAGYQNWLRALEKAMEGDPAGARDRAPHDQSPGSPRDDAIEGEIVRSMAQQPTIVRDRPTGVMPGESNLRVWDLCRPYLLSAALCVGVGLFVVFGLLTALRWYTSEYSGPSQQRRFDALWGAHRRGDDIASPEALEGAVGAESETAVPETPIEAPPGQSPQAPPEPEHPDGAPPEGAP